MRIFVKAHPKSKKIQVLVKDETHYEIWVKEPPDKGKANQAVIDALSDYLDVARSRLSIKVGLASRNKVVEII